jgi:tryptophan synthase beta chain
MTTQPDQGGHFGPYGGRFVPEVLMAPIEELESAYLAAHVCRPADAALLRTEAEPIAGRGTHLPEA